MVPPTNLVNRNENATLLTLNKNRQMSLACKRNLMQSSSAAGSTCTSHLITRTLNADLMIRLQVYSALFMRAPKNSDQNALMHAVSPSCFWIISSPWTDLFRPETNYIWRLVLPAFYHSRSRHNCCSTQPANMGTWLPLSCISAYSACLANPWRYFRSHSMHVEGSGIKEQW